MGSKLCAKGSVNSVRSVREKTIHTHTYNVLFLTEEHRRTEHTKAHRDIKSTDFTEPYTHL